LNEFSSVMKIHTDIQYNAQYKANVCLVFSSTAEIEVGPRNLLPGLLRCCAALCLRAAGCVAHCGARAVSLHCNFSLATA
jgi:hypothetical protein